MVEQKRLKLEGVVMFKIENSDSEDLKSLMNEEEYLSTIET